MALGTWGAARSFLKPYLYLFWNNAISGLRYAAISKKIEISFQKRTYYIPISSPTTSVKYCCILSLALFLLYIKIEFYKEVELYSQKNVPNVPLKQEYLLKVILSRKPTGNVLERVIVVKKSEKWSPITIHSDLLGPLRQIILSKFLIYVYFWNP